MGMWPGGWVGMVEGGSAVAEAMADRGEMGKGWERGAEGRGLLDGWIDG